MGKINENLTDLLLKVNKTSLMRLLQLFCYKMALTGSTEHANFTR